MQHIGDLIIQRIKNREPGWMLSAKDFIDLGSRQAIDTALHRLESRHVIRRIARGIYDCPRQSKLTGKAASPDIWIAAQTLGRKNGWKIQPSGETALNLLGLSTQVPGTFVFWGIGDLSG
jgi:predicted transcriptional regulator of viral defense system